MRISAWLSLFYRSCFVLLLLFLAPAFAPAQTTIPDIPAGHTLTAWLQAFNSGDQAQLDAYYHKHDPSKSAADIMPFRKQTGGFELLQILKSEPLHLEFLVKERLSDTRALAKLDLKDASGQVANFSLRALPPGASVSQLNFTLDAATRTEVINGALADLNEFYVSPGVAKQMADAIRARQKRGEYDSVTDGDAFATMLTANLRDVSHDKHLRVDFSPTPLPKLPPNEDPRAQAEFRKQMERMNCGFDKVEILPDNIGYLKFDFFADPSVCKNTATAAMDFLANSDAVIFDLRENGGGDPAMVQYICSYLFSSRTHLNDLWTRSTNSTQEFWTLPSVPRKFLATQPVYVLTSHRTFSGGEEFTYDLQQLKRATIVGEVTGGGAHPVSGHRIDDHFEIGVPFATAINPITHTSWEGTGVTPGVKVPAADALTTAEKLAAEQLAKNSTVFRQ
ncbi:MAG: S41 family peptidase [Candidatus Acidiferrales bacterium]